MDADFTGKDSGYAEVTKNPNHVGLFKAPTLRNIALTAPYMHDGRFETLKEVLDHYSEHVEMSPTINESIFIYAPQGGAQLTEQQKHQVIAFLHTLTDSSLLTNPSYSNPW